jgi:non-ribosomal peptide synthetase component F
VATEYNVAYIHHTSGTSSGLPKPIPQTHHAAVSVLPCLDDHDFATFTAAPLYPGGISDFSAPGRAKL